MGRLIFSLRRIPSFLLVLLALLDLIPKDCHASNCKILDHKNRRQHNERPSNVNPHLGVIHEVCEAKQVIVEAKNEEFIEHLLVIVKLCLEWGFDACLNHLEESCKVHHEDTEHRLLN